MCFGRLYPQGPGFAVAQFNFSSNVFRDVAESLYPFLQRPMPHFGGEGPNMHIHDRFAEVIGIFGNMQNAIQPSVLMEVKMLRKGALGHVDFNGRDESHRVIL